MLIAKNPLSKKLLKHLKPISPNVQKKILTETSMPEIIEEMEEIEEMVEIEIIEIIIITEQFHLTLVDGEKND